ncbi:hypothetical protein J6590_000284 [Homalodisca vitripennis]|nr:hypothetical protein J6590_000284 [Homalodisca vitripennis]
MRCMGPVRTDPDTVNLWISHVLPLSGHSPLQDPHGDLPSPSSGLTKLPTRKSIVIDLTLWQGFCLLLYGHCLLSLMNKDLIRYSKSSSLKLSENAFVLEISCGQTELLQNFSSHKSDFNNAQPTGVIITLILIERRIQFDNTSQNNERADTQHGVDFLEAMAKQRAGSPTHTEVTCSISELGHVYLENPNLCTQSRTTFSYFPSHVNERSGPQKRIAPATISLIEL